MDRPDAWTTGRPNLIAAFPSHVPMGLPLPPPTAPPAHDDDRPDHEYSL